MVISEFIDILKEKRSIQQSETEKLKIVIEEFPYFQAAKIMYIKGLKNQDSFKYNNELKITSAYTTDRAVLFDYITAKDFNDKDNMRVDVLDKKPNTDELLSSFKKEEEATKIKEELKIGKPISFSASDSYSFNEWLQLSTHKVIGKKLEESRNKTYKKEDLVDKFIENNPKIKPLSEGKKISVSIDEIKQDTELMTETLVKVYLEQNKFSEAIKAYRILTLKYLEKSVFFADQIKKVRILQKNKL